MFLLLRRLSPQAKDLCGKLSANDNNILSPAVGGRKKRNGESGQLQKLVPQKQIGRTFQGKTACFPLWRLAQARSLRQSPFSAKRSTRPFAFHRGRQSRRASRDWIKWLLAPAHRRRPDAISFCSKEALNQSARADGEKFFVRKKALFRRNT